MKKLTIVIFLIMSVIIGYLLLQKDESLSSNNLNEENNLSVCERILTSDEFLKEFDFSAEQKYEGPVAQVVFDGRWPDAANFRARIEEAVIEGANFAGHYTVALWGCGTSCQQGAVVDVKTGEIVYYGLKATEGISFLPNSRILITNPRIDASAFAADQDFENYVHYAATFAREYYYLQENEDGQSYLKKLCVESGADGYDF